MIGGFASHPDLAPANEREMQRAHMIFGLDGFFGYGYCDQRRPDMVMWWSHLPRNGETNGQEYKAWLTEDLRNKLLGIGVGLHR